jgi:6-phosphogluconolactonase
MRPINTSRVVVGTLLLAALLLGVPAARAQQESKQPMPPPELLEKEPFVYVGTYTEKGSKGIYAFRLQTKGLEVSQNITLVPLGLAAEAENPSFLEVDQKRRLLFAVNEIDTFNGKASGAVSAYKIHPDGKLAFINQVASGGAGPCHLVLDKEGKHLLIANYGAGSVAVIPVAEDGKLGEATDVKQHEGKSVHPERQKGPHAHCVTLSPDNAFAYVCDLGLDKVMVYKFDAKAGKLMANDPAFVATKPGAGPRHMAFRPDGKFAYVLNELDSTVSTYAADATTGALKELQTISTLPGYYDGPNTAAEIQMHPTGKWVYTSNRGNETIILFNVDAEKGTLTWVEEQNTGGKKPRHFGLEPTPRHMIICNQDSDMVLISRIDKDNGRLKPSGVFTKVPSPACGVFVPVAPTQATSTED